MSQWIIRRDRLDPDQRRIVDSPIRGNIWIAGFAGSGKSVILVHKALSILQSNPSARVVFLVYTQSLVDMFKTGLHSLGHDEIGVRTIYDFMSRPENYDYILCDEVQDFTESMIQSVRSHASRNVIVAGDKFQSIFEQDVKYKEPTIDPYVLVNELSAQSEELTKIYRLTPSIIQAIDSFLPTMHLAVNGRANAEKVNVSIKLCRCNGRREEAKYTFDNAERYLRSGERTAMLFPQYKDCIEFVNYVLDCKGKPQWETQLNRWGRPDFGSLNGYLKQCGIKLMYIGNGYGSLKAAEDGNIGVLMTYQSSKGLDFENVYLPFASSGMFITYNDSRSRTIFMVAMSRSAKNLTITYSGSVFQYVSSFSSNQAICTEVTPNASAGPDTTDDDPFDF